MNHLTLIIMAAILTPLLPHVAVGSRSPRKAAKGHYKTWFFCTHQKYNSILLWWGVSSNPLKGWPRLGGTSNLITSPPPNNSKMLAAAYPLYKESPHEQ